jgi:CRISP-associated protein Cas1
LADLALQSLLIERENADKVHVPITDVRDIVACAETDINTAAISLLNRYRINIHFLSYYGDYAGSLLTSETSTSGEPVLAQAGLAEDPHAALELARAIVDATAFNVGASSTASFWTARTPCSKTP